MKVTVRQLAELVGGTVLGDGDLVIESASPLLAARPGSITFVENDKYAPLLKQSQASAALVPANIPLNGKALIQVADPLMSFVLVYQHFHGAPPRTSIGIDPRALVHPSAQIGAETSVLPFAVVRENAVIGKGCWLDSGVVVGSDCRLGDEVVLHCNVVLGAHSVIGDRVVIHPNSVIGADGFGYRLHQGRHLKVPHLSHVVIGNDVEIGACSTIDRGVFEPTRVGAGTKIDNHVQVAHNCQIGKHNLLAAQVGVGGSTATGSHVTLAGQVGIADHTRIGDRAIIAAQSGVRGEIPADECMFGSPGRPMREQRRIHATLEKLPEMRRDIQRLKKHLDLPENHAGAESA